MAQIHTIDGTVALCLPGKATVYMSRDSAAVMAYWLRRAAAQGDDFKTAPIASDRFADAFHEVED